MRRLIWHWRTGTCKRLVNHPSEGLVGSLESRRQVGRNRIWPCATRKVNLKYRITSSIYKSSFLGSNFSKCEKLDWGCCPPVIFTSTLVSKNVKRNRPKEAKNQPRCRMTIQEEFLKFTFTMVCWRVINTSNVLSGMVWGDGVALGPLGSGLSHCNAGSRGQGRCVFLTWWKTCLRAHQFFRHDIWEAFHDVYRWELLPFFCTWESGHCHHKIIYLFSITLLKKQFLAKHPRCLQERRPH